VGGVSIVGLMATPEMYFSVWSWDAAYMLPMFLLLWGLAANSRTLLARGLGSRPMVVAGEGSFAFYLLHVPLIGVLRIDGPNTWTGWVVTTGLLYLVILLVAGQSARTW